MFWRSCVSLPLLGVLSVGEECGVTGCLLTQLVVYQQFMQDTCSSHPWARACPSTGLLSKHRAAVLSGHLIVSLPQDVNGLLPCLPPPCMCHHENCGGAALLLVLSTLSEKAAAS